MFHRILFVCTGNICRSPLAEALLRQQLHDDGKTGVEVASAGIGALVAAPADATTCETARELPALADSLARHRGAQITQDMTRWANLILVMEPHHLEFVTQLDATARGKTFLLGHWLKQNIPDPYRKSEAHYQATQALVLQAVGSWRDKL